MRAHGLELRQRSVDAVAAGHPKAAVAQLFQADRSTINRYLRQAAAHDLAPHVSPVRPSRIHPTQDAELVCQLTVHPTATLAEHCALWEAHTGVHIDPSTMSRHIARVGLTRKKGRWQPASVMKRPGLPGGPRRSRPSRR